MSCYLLVETLIHLFIDERNFYKNIYEEPQFLF